MPTYNSLQTGSPAIVGGTIGVAFGSIIASAATITVSASLHKVTGTATISTINGGIEGRIYVLKSEGGFVVNEAGNIRAGARTVVAGRSLFLLFDGANFCALDGVALNATESIGTGSKTFTNILTVNNGGNCHVALGNVTAAVNAVSYRLLAGTAKYGWALGAQNFFHDTFEIMPTTAAGSTTLASPVVQIQSGGNVGLGVTPSDRLHLSTGALRIEGTGSFVGSKSRLYNDAGSGLIVSGCGGTSYDMVFVNKNGSTFIANPTGTNNVLFPGTIRERNRATPIGEWAGVRNGTEFGGYTFNAGDFTASGAMTWTVGLADLVDFRYTLIGKTMILLFDIEQTTVGGVVDLELRIKLPGGAITDGEVWGWARYNDNGGGVVAGQVAATTAGGGQNYVSIFKLPPANWTLATNTTNVAGQIIIPIQ